MTQAAPQGWTDEACPKGHLRSEHEYAVRGKTQRIRCRQCDRDNRERRAAAKEEGIDMMIDRILLDCTHEVRYRRGLYNSREPLWCCRCEGWIHQAAVAWN